ncbi:MAG: hypothetical protein ISR48_02420 [Alphaproteobacteria bacterium]|nr:hypothetical protein [Alphaproteobacteria bacterium]
MNDLDEIKRRLDGFSAFCATVREALKGEGSLQSDVDLSGMEKEVGEICALIGTLPGSEGEPLLNSLIALSDEIAHLEEDLKEQHQALAEEIRGISDRQRATSAYGSSLPPKTK